MNMDTDIILEYNGTLPVPLREEDIQAAAEAFAHWAQRWSKPDQPWSEVTIYLIHDTISAEVNLAIMNHTGPTDVITQRYDSLPGESGGLVGELYVNLDEAARICTRLKTTHLRKEVLLYIAHGCDHLTDADDATPAESRTMRTRDLSWVRRWIKDRPNQV